MNRASLPDTPYMGLVPYSEKDAEFFFGREAEEQIIMANLMASRLTVLYGPSGVGKSSVLRAGVAHTLNNIARENLASWGKPEFAVVVFSSWRDEPVAALLSQVGQAVERAVAGGQLEPASYATLREALYGWSKQMGGHLFIILDQFEEYFLYHSKNRSSSFAAEFAEAVNDPGLRANFIVSLREDWLAKLDYFKGLIPHLFDNYLRIEHLNLEAAREAITKPLEKYNSLVADPAQRVRIEGELVEEVLRQLEPLARRVGLTETGRGAVAGHDGGDAYEARIQPSYLQLVMMRIWDCESRRWEREQCERVLTAAALRELGDANKILRTHLETVMKNLTAEDRDAAARVFHYLVTPDGTKIAYTASNLAKLAELDEAELTRVLEKLADKSNSILTRVAAPPDQPEASRYEIFHDMLAPAILEWRAQYVQAQRQAAAEKRAAEEAAKREKEAAIQLQVQEQTRAAKSLRRLAAALAFALMLAVVAAGFAFVQKARADEARQEAERLRGVAEERRQEAEQQSLIAQKRSDEAHELRRIAEKAARDESEQRKIAELERNKAEMAAERERAAKLQIDAQRQIAEQRRQEAEAQRKEADEQRAKAEAEKQRADEARAQIEQQERITSARLIGVRADSIGSFRPDLTQMSVLLGAESNDIAPNLEADRALSNGLAKLPKQVRPAIDYSEDRKGAAYMPTTLSRDGKHLATSYSGRELNSSGVKLWDAATGKPIASIPSKYQVMSIKFSGDGKYILYQEEDWHVWDIANRREVFRTSLPHQRELHDVSRDGKVVAIRRGSEVEMVDMATKRSLATFNGAPGSSDFAFSPDGQTYATTAGKLLRLWSYPDGGEIRTIENDSDMKHLAFSPKGDYIAATGDNPPSVKVWDAKTGALILTGSLQSAPSRIIFSPEGKQVAAQAYEAINIWELPAAASGPAATPGPKPATATLSLTGAAMSMVFSPDGDHMAAATTSNTISVWAWREAQEIAAITPGISPSHYEIAFSPDGYNIIGAGSEHTKVWSVLGTQPDPRIEQGKPGMLLGVSSDGERLLTASEDGVTLRRADNGEVVRSFAIDPDADLAVASPNARYLAAVSSREVKIFDTSSGEQVLAATIGGFIFKYSDFLKEDSGPTPILFSPDNRHAAIVGEGILNIVELPSGKHVTKINYSGEGGVLGLNFADYTVTGEHIYIYGGESTQLWNALTGEKYASISSDEESWPLISPDGKRITTIDKGVLRVMELPGKRELFKATLDSDQYFPLAFSADSRRISLVSDEGITVWDIDAGKEVPSLRRDLGPLAEGLGPLNRQRRLSSDESVDFTASRDYMSVVINGTFVRVWGTTTGEVLHASIAPSDRVIISPDGKYVFGVDADKGKIGRWRLQPLDFVKEACQRVTKNLDEKEWRKYVGNKPYRKTCPELN